MPEFKFAGRTYYTQAEMLTPDELFGIVGASGDLRERSRLVSVRADGTYVLDRQVDVTQHSNLDHISREIYIKAQVASIAEVYGERYGLPIQLDDRLEYLFIPRFPLPGRWGARESPILIHIPPGYPTQAPDGFFLSSRCRGPHVLGHNVYNGLDFSGYGWKWFCVHCQQGWRPGANAMDSDNLWTFLKVVRAALSIDEF
jgi:Prokaryotic E2 family E